MDEFYWIWDQAGMSPGEEEPVERRRDYQIPPTPATVVYHLRGEEYIWEGELWRIDGIGLDERTRTVPCRVIVRNPQEVWVERGGERRPARGGPPALVRGMYVDVTIQVDSTSTLLLVPETAVRPADNGEKVWLARPIQTDPSAAAGKPGEATHELLCVCVDTVDIVGDEAVVRAGPGQLAAGDVVVEEPLGMETDGKGVTVNEVSEQEE
jgi:hypothetical protein